jgi:threonine dehydratase
MTAPPEDALMVNLGDVTAAQRAIAGRVHRTPLVSSAALSTMIDAPLSLKLECWQKTGSFKPRGVLNKLRALSAEERGRGLVTASAGNHAQALAWAAGAEGIPCTVVMPATAPQAKVDATRGYGATIVHEPDVLRLFDRVNELVAARGLTFVHPFDDAAVLAGQGTVGLEILEDLPETGTVVIPIGGGGLIAGMAVALKERKPGLRIVGVEPEGAASMWRSRQSGRPERLEKVDTIADGLGAPYAGELAFSLVQRYVDDLVLVTDSELRRAMVLLLERCKVLAEPAGAAGVAALLAGKASVHPGSPVVAVISGGNIDAGRLARLLSETAAV